MVRSARAGRVARMPRAALHFGVEPMCARTSSETSGGSIGARAGPRHASGMPSNRTNTGLGFHRRVRGPGVDISNGVWPVVVPSARTRVRAYDGPSHPGPGMVSSARAGRAGLARRRHARDRVPSARAGRASSVPKATLAMQFYRRPRGAGRRRRTADDPPSVPSAPARGRDRRGRHRPRPVASPSPTTRRAPSVRSTVSRVRVANRRARGRQRNVTGRKE